MSMHSCDAPLAFTDLADYWIGELPADVDARIEEQIFSCDACSRGLDEVMALGADLRRWVRRARLRGNITATLAARLEADRLAVRRFRVEPGGTLFCTVAPDDDLVMVEFVAPPAGAARVDGIFRERVGDRFEETRVADVGVAESGSLFWMETGAALKPLQHGELHIALVAVEPAGERVIAQYELRHTPWPGRTDQP